MWTKLLPEAGSDGYYFGAGGGVAGLGNPPAPSAPLAPRHVQAHAPVQRQRDWHIKQLLNTAVVRPCPTAMASHDVAPPPPLHPSTALRGSGHLQHPPPPRDGPPRLPSPAVHLTVPYHPRPATPQPPSVNTQPPSVTIQRPSVTAQPPAVITKPPSAILQPPSAECGQSPAGHARDRRTPATACPPPYPRPIGAPGLHSAWPWAGDCRSGAAGEAVGLGDGPCVGHGTLRPRARALCPG